jgi:hypothetical protein
VEKWANQALRIDVLDADLHHAAGQSLLTQATADDLPLEQQQQIAIRAAQALATAVQLATTSPDALDADLPGWQYQLAQALAKAGNTTDARTRLEKLLQEVPDHADGKKLLETLKP